MARHDRIPANELRSTLDYAEAVIGSANFHLFHDIEPGSIDFRMVVGRLLDLGAPIADWRFDPRVFAVQLTDEMPVYYETVRYHEDTRRYGGEAAEALRGIRREYEKRLIDWLYADKPKVRMPSHEGKVCHWLIQHMPSVEEFVDEDFPVMGAVQ
ncbi:hypothetical protein [Sphingopyxis macrogoltabida]|uniref:Uncharacterized protein n=1 Tax=Sphingopyxis macrogoltabida TaxID=33050 RepID=A0AAC9AVG8_SPHMC|nr:hypothetical protein [Sphingopyxis macrogoltabida]ALJ12600.1 hypothetical protein LH19_06950 [Sphingopyxis macrogoltabida]AMU89929.1 hypothetical protein ATM17_12870 [Sphingopyxis macrogoltabida]